MHQALDLAAERLEVRAPLRIDLQGQRDVAALDTDALHHPQSDDVRVALRIDDAAQRIEDLLFGDVGHFAVSPGC